MQETTRRSIWAKVVALSFIGLILLCNIWFAFYIGATPPPWWLGLCFQIFAAIAISSSIILSLTALYRRINLEPGE
jgi:hypothetical protein